MKPFVICESIEPFAAVDGVITRSMRGHVVMCVDPAVVA